MSELGQWLREARQAKGLSLEQVEAKTRIRTKFLTYLEEGNYGDLPGEVYTRGFLRNYALFLGLDPTEALEKYDSRVTSRQGNEPGLFRPLEVALLHTTIGIGRLRGRLVLLILIAGLLTAGLWAWRTGRLAWPPPLALFQAMATPTTTPSLSHTPVPTSQPSPTAMGELTVTSTPSPTPRPTLTPGALPRPTSTPTLTVTAGRATVQPTTERTTESPTPSTTLESVIGVTVSITVTEESWVEVTLDGLNDFRGLLNAGEGRTWQARREIILRLGNAGGVQVTVNGEFLGTLGERQQVVEFAWGPEGEVTPEPTATATSEATTETREIPLE